MKITKIFHEKRMFYAIFFMIILFSPLFSYFTLASLGYASNMINSPIPLENAYNPSSSSNTSEVSSVLSDPANGYNFSTSTSYKVDINFKIWNSQQLPTEGNLYLWDALLKSQGTSQFPGTPQNQIVKLLGRHNDGTNFTYNYDEIDDYGNSYDFYNLTFVPNQQNYFTFDYVYNVTIRETNWTINPANIGQYNKNEYLYLNNTGAESHLQANDPFLDNLSYQICNASGVNNVVDKAHAIYNWLVKNMKYHVQTADKGALFAGLNRTGDCSDFSDLMVTLLRIQDL